MQKGIVEMFDRCYRARMRQNPASFIETTNGDRFLVDESMFESLSRLTWHTMVGGGRKYAIRYERIKGKTKALLMHRVITSSPTGMVVDHIDGNTQDNRLVNLRVCTNQENMRNRVKIPSSNTSGVLGVHWNRREQKWRAVIQANGKYIRLGSFTDIQSAVVARQSAAKKYFGDYVSRLDRRRAA